MVKRVAICFLLAGCCGAEVPTLDYKLLFELQRAYTDVLEAEKQLSQAKAALASKRDEAAAICGGAERITFDPQSRELKCKQADPVAK